ncbi:MAG: glycyl-radical enzyme activating protein [Erysipelotrichaceae bacterium]|nr:glycyl-radical enzyme activating protein [Erysipelotrichaceae bacterium]
MQGLVGKIQHYSIKDGPGIRTTVFLSGCTLRCKWCSNPEFLKQEPALMYFKDRCRKCGSCATAYPEAVRLTEEGCVIDREKADYDALVEICPYDSYEKHGTQMEAEELVRELLKDREFYETSNGGVTFSGGECLLQSGFVLECMRLLHAERIHVTIDTAGNVPWEKIENVMKEADLVLYDIKAYDSEMHRRCTGSGNELIIENLKRISRLGKDVIIRMVIVPGRNDDPEDIEKRIDLVKGMKNIRQIDFLKYHILGVGKYEKLGLEYELTGIGNVDETLLENARKYAEKSGIKTTIGG